MKWDFNNSHHKNIFYMYTEKTIEITLKFDENIVKFCAKAFQKKKNTPKKVKV